MLRAGIVTVVVLLMVLLCLTRVGVRAAFGGGEFRLDARIGPLRIHILPAKAKKPKAGGARRGKGPKEPKGPKKPKEAGAKPSIAWEDVRDALRTLLPALGRALRRIGRCGCPWSWEGRRIPRPRPGSSASCRPPSGAGCPGWRS